MGAAALGVAQSQMQQEHDPKADFPWWVRYMAKGIGILGGFVAMFFAVLGFVTLSPTCMIAVTIQLVFGFLIIALEAPFCCTFVDFIEKIDNFSESRTFWQKAVLYCGMGIVPILICPELNTVLGGGMIFASGSVYGFLALGKKADQQTMMKSAAYDPWEASIQQV
ncbi:hypothetical protein L596_019989 [Steinernema carpocapsae]|uniref:Calcium channel flower n=1 Tax=Steinernema carpocapsae TaxID=34508 RepID=A0A4U5MT13_STECR|nr:hypothetical protein L596_019989 [Steinernema carpocapsae]